MNHAMLVKRGALWLKKAAGCRAILMEPRSPRNEEHPDIIGWTPDGASIVIEAKSNRVDYRDDWRPDRKRFRHHPAEGMGLERYYICPYGVITPTDVHRRGWGLLYACPNGMVLTKVLSPDHSRNSEAELRLIIRMAKTAENQKQMEFPGIL